MERIRRSVVNPTIYKVLYLRGDDPRISWNHQQYQMLRDFSDTPVHGSLCCLACCSLLLKHQRVQPSCSYWTRLPFPEVTQLLWVFGSGVFAKWGRWVTWMRKISLEKLPGIYPWNFKPENQPRFWDSYWKPIHFRVGSSFGKKNISREGGCQDLKMTWHFSCQN